MCLLFVGISIGNQKMILVSADFVKESTETDSKDSPLLPSSEPDIDVPLTVLFTKILESKQITSAPFLLCR